MVGGRSLNEAVVFTAPRYRKEALLYSDVRFLKRPHHAIDLPNSGILSTTNPAQNSQSCLSPRDSCRST